MTYSGTGVNSSIDQLVQQLGNQHAAISNKLDAILSALGAPPPTQTVTLADVVTSLNVLNTNISTLRTEIAAQQTVLLGSVNSINSQLTSFRQENIAWRNFQQGQLGNILAAISSLVDEQTLTTNAIYATACPCDGQTQLPPDLGTTPLPSAQQQEHCRRVQWMINEFFSVWMARIRDVMVAINGTGTALALGALAATGVGAIPATLIGGAAVAANAAWFAGISGIINEANDARRTQLRQALYNASSPAAAAAAWNTTIDSMTDVAQPYRDVWKAFIWSSWFNDLYDQAGKTPATTGGAWNTAGYDGTVCAPPPPPSDEWVLFTSGIATLSAGQTANISIPTSLNYRDLAVWAFTPITQGDTSVSIQAFSGNSPDANSTVPRPEMDFLLTFLGITPINGAQLRILNRHGSVSSSTEYKIYYRT